MEYNFKIMLIIRLLFIYLCQLPWTRKRYIIWQLILKISLSRERSLKDPLKRCRKWAPDWAWMEVSGHRRTALDPLRDLNSLRENETWRKRTMHSSKSMWQIRINGFFPSKVHRDRGDRKTHTSIEHSTSWTPRAKPRKWSQVRPLIPRSGKAWLCQI